MFPLVTLPSPLVHTVCVYPVLTNPILQSTMFLPSHKPFLALASPFLLLSLATAMQQSHPFLAGDVWRGHLSSCSAIKSFGKNDVHVVDMTVVEGTPSSLKAMFTEQTTKSQYVMHGQYSASTLAFTLTFGEWIHQPKESSWIPCDAVGVVDRSMSVITGDAVCSSKPGKTASKEKCQYAGGGEFVLRHDRTSFTVEGAGDTSVNGEYSSIPKDHDLFKSETYEGVPLYSQVTCDPMSATPPRARGCDNKHVMAQRIVGVQKFWIITDVGSLHLHDHMDYDSEVEVRRSHAHVQGPPHTHV